MDRKKIWTEWLSRTHKKLWQLTLAQFSWNMKKRRLSFNYFSVFLVYIPLKRKMFSSCGEPFNKMFNVKIRVTPIIETCLSEEKSITIIKDDQTLLIIMDAANEKRWYLCQSSGFSKMTLTCGFNEFPLSRIDWMHLIKFRDILAVNIYVPSDASGGVSNTIIIEYCCCYIFFCLSALTICSSFHFVWKIKSSDFRPRKLYI